MLRCDNGSWLNITTSNVPSPTLTQGLISVNKTGREKEREGEGKKERERVGLGRGATH